MRRQPITGRVGFLLAFDGRLCDFLGLQLMLLELRAVGECPMVGASATVQNVAVVRALPLGCKANGGLLINFNSLSLFG